MAANETRNIFFDTIYQMMKRNNDIVIISVDLAGPPFDRIRMEYPDRYISVGIAEQNAIAVGCGLTTAGKRVIVYAANPFPLLRAFDQIRNCACMMNLPINIVGLGTGFSVAECGATHLNLEDIAMSSLCPNLKTISISDNTMARAAAMQVEINNAPRYYRLGKWAGSILSEELPDFSKGFRKIREGKDIALLSASCSVRLLAEMDMSMESPALFDVFSVPFDSTALLSMLKQYRGIIVYEEQLKRGGLGSIILELLSDCNEKIPIKRMGIELKDGYPQIYGSREYWLRRYGLDRDSVIREVRNLKNGVIAE